jgi:hypothetical protein
LILRIHYFAVSAALFATNLSPFLNKSGKSRKNSSGFLESWRCGKRAFAHEHNKNEDLGSYLASRFLTFVL